MFQAYESVMTYAVYESVVIDFAAIVHNVNCGEYSYDVLYVFISDCHIFISVTACISVTSKQTILIGNNRAIILLPQLNQYHFKN